MIVIDESVRGDIFPVYSPLILPNFSIISCYFFAYIS